MRLHYFIALLTLLFAKLSLTQVWLHPNKGQWHEEVLYKVELSTAQLFVDRNGFSIVMLPNMDHEHLEANNAEYDLAYVVKAHYLNNTWQGELDESGQTEYYRNYFYGNDSTKWQSNVHSVRQSTLKNFYPNIDYDLSIENEQLKYSFIVHPGADISSLQYQISGANRVVIEDGKLIYETPNGQITESAPISWQEDDKGNKIFIASQFELVDSIVHFAFPQGYDTSKKLIIDPSLIFSSFTGSTADNWGMTATPGPNGEAYGGGIVFATGYPVTAGALDLTYNGGTPNGTLPGIDMGISKFNATGSTLLYSTYIGGLANELPMSIIASPNGDLNILGISSSPNFPVSASAYDNSYAGGPTINLHSLKFIGSDIVVLKLSSNGSSIVGSTFFGGSGLDGFNDSELDYNYGDQYRGEIIVDDQNNIYIASTTKSTNFPFTDGASLQGIQDAVIAKFNNNLSALQWSKRFGGSGSDAAYSLTISENDELYVTGGTNSTDLTLAGAQPSSLGQLDGFLIKANKNTGNISNGTFIGSTQYDQSYLVQTDLNNGVYVFGQTELMWTCSPGVYCNPNSGQFISKYDENLSTVEWTTSIGAETGHPEISPTAFLVSDCFDIFISGWGGSVNSSNSSAVFSSSNNFPVTADAYQSTTNGSNFYLAVLSGNAENLIYGTYMGGLSSSYNHVDGGTSRFDKSGAVYHAVCAACGGNDNGFTSTPGAWSETNNSPNCNLALFKFQIGIPYFLSADTVVCSGATFQLNASGGLNFEWTPAEFLDDPFSPNPMATIDTTTVFYVEMDLNAFCSIVDSVIVDLVDFPIISIPIDTAICINDTVTINTELSFQDNFRWLTTQFISSQTSLTPSVWPPASQYYVLEVSNSCFTALDSVYVDVHELPEIVLSNDTTICFGGMANLSASGGTTYEWPTQEFLTELGLNTATVNPVDNHDYLVIGYDDLGCANSDTITVSVYPIPPITISNDTTVCVNIGGNIQVTVPGATSYQWSPASGLSNPTSSTPFAQPSVPTLYTVSVTYGNGCELADDVYVDLNYLPTGSVQDTVVVCRDESTKLIANGTDVTNYTWSPGTFLNTTSGSEVISTPLNNIEYTCHFSNMCGSVNDKIYVKIRDASIIALGDTTICPGESTNLFALGGTSYHWTPESMISNPNTSMVSVTPQQPTLFRVIGIDEYGCKDTDSVFVNLHPRAVIQANPDIFAIEGDENFQLYATSTTAGPYQWSPEEYLSCVVCPAPMASVDTTTTFYVKYTDENGCSAGDSVNIRFDVLIFVPNTFTPNNSNFNDNFKAIASNITAFEITIFDRWGEIIFQSIDINEAWDGTYQGVECQDGTYVWKIRYRDMDEIQHELVGHVNLLR